MFKKNISKLLLIITVFIFVFVATVFIFENVKVKADTGFTSVTVNGDQTEQGSRSEKFINEINNLDAVDRRMDSGLEFFNNLVFRSLIDSTVVIPEEEKGRSNPFAPLGQ